MKNINLLFLKLTLLLLLPTSIFSQEFISDFSHVFISDYYDNAKIQIDDNGNTIIAGIVNGNTDLDISATEESLTPSNFFRDGVISKYDSDQSLLWSAYLDKVATLILRGLDTDSEGNVYVTGSFVGSLVFEPDGTPLEITAFGSSQLFIAKYDPNGNFLWVKQIGDTTWDQWSTAIFDNDDKLLLHIIFTGNIDFDPGPGSAILNGNGSNAFLTLDHDGNFIEVRKLDGTQSVNDMNVDNNGNILVGGIFTNDFNADFNGSFMLTTSDFLADGYVIKYDKDFNLLWAKGMGDSFDSEQVREVAGNNQGETFIALKNDDETEIDNLTITEDKFYLIKFDIDGNAVMAAELMPDNSSTNDMEVDSDGTVIISISQREATEILVNGVTIPLEYNQDNDYSILVAANSQLSYTNVSQIFASDLSTTNLTLDANNRIHYTTSFEGQGEVIFGESTMQDAQDGQYLAYGIVSRPSCAATEGMIDVAACDSISINDEVFMESGSFTQTLINSAGCDSTLNIVLEIINLEVNITVTDEFLSTDVNSAYTYAWVDCNTMELIEGADSDVFIPQTSGDYAVQITDDNGCVATSNCINWVICEATEFMIAEIVCDSLVINGQVYTQSGTYEQNLFNNAGCDSTIIINLEIIDLQVTAAASGEFLSTEANPAYTYAWFDCATMTVVEGENSNIFIPQVNGDYAVQITDDNGCQAMSACVNWMVSNSSDTNYSQFGLSPNPATTALTIVSEHIFTSAIIYDISGAFIQKQDKNTAIKTINISDLQPGVYLLMLKDKKGNFGMEKFVKS